MKLKQNLYNINIINANAEYFTPDIVHYKYKIIVVISEIIYFQFNGKHRPQNLNYEYGGCM